ncbi:putative Na P-type ATPase [Paraphysoderma sedebokerense]|nr:putative Na P-type ATPase [Paraphysoderma sedebokerense]
MDATAIESTAFHTLSTSEVVERFKTDPNKGLSTEQAKEREATFGLNELSGDGGVSAWKVLFTKLVNPMNGVLFFALIMSAVGNDIAEIIVLGFVIITNTLIGFRQEYKSEKTMEALRAMASPTARCLRNQEVSIIPANQLVPGDIVFLEEGDQIPADLRIIQAVNLNVNEALLTGEPIPVRKNVDPISDADIPLGDRINSVFASTLVALGRGTGVVVRTGSMTEIGKIAKEVASGTSEKTPLEKTMMRMMFFLLGCSITLAIVCFWVNDWNISDQQVLLYGIATAVAILPEGLPAVVTITMAFGVRRMAKQKAIVRRLVSLEALSALTNICSDKTGTLTEGKMSVTQGSIGGVDFEVEGGFGKTITVTSGEQDITKTIADDLKQLVLVASLCNTCTVHFDQTTNIYGGTGDSTELALAIFGEKLGYVKANLSSEYTFLGEFPFDSALKRMTAIYRHEPTQKVFILVKGAFEVLIGLSSQYYIAANSSVEPITGEFKDEVASKVTSLAKKGLRVLSIGWKVLEPEQVTAEFLKEIDEVENRNKIEVGFTFGGLLGLMDPPRPETAHSVAACHKAGIKVHMITGDHPATAEAIARKIGIVPATLVKTKNIVMTSTEFDSKTEEELDALPELPLVVARCSPETKVKMVQALHRRKRFVVMTGDGVNDSPAIKRADVGIAMGLGGSDVTKQASDITLTDDNFATIVSAISEGRRIFGNVKKFTLHLLSGNVSEVIAMVVGLAVQDAAGVPIFPMSPLQILWVNTATSSPVALALGIERGDRDIMSDPPRNDGVFTPELLTDTFFYGFIMGSLSLGNFLLTMMIWPGDWSATTGCNKNYRDPACEGIFRGRAVSFYTLTSLLLVHGYVCRSPRLHLWQMKWTGIRALNWAILAGFVTLAPLAYIPGLNTYIFYQMPFEYVHSDSS